MMTVWMRGMPRLGWRRARFSGTVLRCDESLEIESKDCSVVGMREALVDGTVLYDWTPETMRRGRIGGRDKD